MSFVYAPRPTGVLLISGIGLSLLLHGSFGMAWFRQPLPPPMTEQDVSLKGREFIDLAPIEMLMATPETDLTEGEMATDSQEALDTADERVMAKAVNDPILAQIPYEVDDPELEFRVANPLEEDQGEIEADEVPTEVQEDKHEVMAQASTAAAPAPSAGQDAQSGSAEEEVGLSDEEKSRITEWQKDLVLALAQAKSYPKAARKAKAQGKVTVLFTIDPYGRILARQVQESSGWPVLDRAALDLLDGFDRLPAPPAVMGAGPFDLRFPISYAFK